MRWSARCTIRTRARLRGQRWKGSIFRAQAALRLERSSVLNDRRPDPMASPGYRCLSPLLGGQPVCAAADHEGGTGGLCSDHRFVPYLFVPATGRDSPGRGAMTSFNEHPTLYILLWAAAGIGFVGLVCYWIWNWLNS